MRDYTIFIPEYIAAGSAVGIIGIELFWPKFRKDWLAYITAIAALGWLVSGLFFIGKDPNSFGASSARTTSPPTSGCSPRAS